jgi:hypothetical protein
MLVNKSDLPMGLSVDKQRVTGYRVQRFHNDAKTSEDSKDFGATKSLESSSTRNCEQSSFSIHR